MVQIVRQSAWIALVLLVAAPAAQGTQFRPVTTCCRGGGRVWMVSQPVFSPDARDVAYCVESQDLATEKPRSSIEFLAIEGPSVPGMSLPAPDWGRQLYPAWSPVGHQLAFGCESSDPERAGIWVAEYLASEGRTSLRRWVASADARDPAWLPDGTSLVYVSHDALWKISSPGAASERMPIPEPVASPSCAIGGIAYIRSDHVWIYDGDRNRQLTFGHGSDATPALSSDGEWIVFVSDRSGQSDLWVVSAGGGTPVRVTEDRAAEIDPAWSAAGDKLVFVSWRDGSPNIWLATGLPFFTTGIKNESWSGVKASWSSRGAKTPTR